MPVDSLGIVIIKIIRIFEITQVTFKLEVSKVLTVYLVLPSHTFFPLAPEYVTLHHYYDKYIGCPLFQCMTNNIKIFEYFSGLHYLLDVCLSHHAVSLSG
jgi:hypothetical protein